MRWTQVTALAAALVAWAASTCAAPLPAPFWSSDDLRAARPTTEVESVVFDLKREKLVAGRPPVVTQERVTLAPTFTHVVEGPRHTLEDQTLCRTIRWRDGEASYATASCYSAVAFRLVEVQNRALLSQVVARSDPKAALSIQAAEAELGVLAPGNRSLAVETSGDTRTYRSGGSIIAQVSGVAAKLSPAEAGLLARYLARVEHLHPYVRSDIVASGNLPARIETDYGPTAPGDARDLMSIANVRRERLAYPLPSGLESAVAVEAHTGGSPRADALARVFKALSQNEPRPTAQETLAALRKAVREKRGLDAVLLLMEITQEQAAALAEGSGTQGLWTELAPVVRQLRDLPDSGPFLEANAVAGAPGVAGDRQAAARYLALTDMDARPYGTFRYVTYANLLATSKDAGGWDPKIAAAMPRERVDNYWTHIAAHPWSANTFKDAGDTYYSDYRTDDAWLAFDLGRAVDPGWRSGVMGSVARFEAGIRAAQPDFF